MASFYGFSFEAMMQMYTITFFAFYREGLKMEARQYRELLKISAVPIMHIDYFAKILSRYDGIIDPQTLELPPKPQDPSFAVDAGSEEAKVLLMSTFSAVKRGLGYGR